MSTRLVSNALRLTRRQAIAACAAGGSLLAPACAEQQVGAVRFGISESVTGQMNLGDARAAMQVWLKRISEEFGLTLVYPASVFEPFSSLASALRNDALDGLISNIFEYRQVMNLLERSTVVIPVQKNKLRYVLLTRGGDQIKNLAGLRARKLHVLDNLYTGLAPVWLSNTLDEAGYPQPQMFFSSVRKTAKATQAILPVFFGQADACLVTEHAFLTLCELNPQVAVRLKPTLTSPEVATLLWTFSRKTSLKDQQRLTRILEGIADTSVGRQVMALFQCDRLAVRPGEFLQPSLAILARAGQRRTEGT